MAYVHSATSIRELHTEPKTGPAARRPGYLRTLFRAMQEARLRQAEREIALYLARGGGKFTDEHEREIERRFLSNQG
jgi:hypothetical protein